MTFVTSWKSIGIGLFAGLASALLVLSPVGGSLLAVPLTMLASLPLVIAALGWGTSPAIAGLMAGTGALLAVSPGIALYFAAFIAPPVVIGSHLIGLSRGETGNLVAAGELDQTPPLDGHTVGPREWYPLGRALVIVAAVVVLCSVLMSALNGFDPSSMSAIKIHAFAHSYAEAMGDVDNSMTSDELTAMLEPAIATTMRLLPFAFTATWTLIAALNLGLGIWITAKSGNLLRPKEDLAGFQLPVPIVGFCAAAFGLWFIGGLIGAVSAAIAGAMAALLLMTGLAVLHTLTRRLSFRLPLLVLVYLFLGLSSLPLLILGAIEPFLHLRARADMRRPANPAPK